MEMPKFMTHTFSVDIMGELEKAQKELHDNPLFFKTFSSILEGFKERKFELTRDEELFTVMLMGCVAYKLANTKMTRSLSQEILKKGDRIVDYECKLDDGNTFVISTDDEKAIDNTLIKRIEEITKRKVVSPLTKVAKEDAEKMHKALVKQLEKEGM